MLALATLSGSAYAYNIPTGYISQVIDFPIYVYNGIDYAEAADITQQNASFSGSLWSGGDITANGNAIVEGSARVAGSAVVTGSMTALYYDHTSDRRLKADVHPVDNALNRILSIRGVEFRWKNTGQKDMGVIAQNVAIAFPEVVHTNSAGMKSVEYDSLVAPLIEAVRELKIENNAMNAEIKGVKAKLAAYGVKK